jgi:CheY-like chemotaxis protein/HPt (histidine-containing phosphotransfer) domain-containing protein
MVAELILAAVGADVVSVENGREAVEACQTSAFDVVLMDLQMPEMDGFEATHAIRTREQITGRHVPIIAMTAHAMHGDRERCLEGGMDDYLPKPVHAAELLRIIQQVLPQRAATPSVEAAATEELPVFDRRMALDRVSGDEQLLDEVVQLFLSDAPSRIAEVRSSLEQGDPKRLQIAAHSLKGSAGYVGAERTAAQARKLEDLGRSGDLSQALEEFRLLEREIEKLRQTVAAFTPEPQTI